MYGEYQKAVSSLSTENFNEINSKTIPKLISQSTTNTVNSLPSPAIRMSRSVSTSTVFSTVSNVTVVPANILLENNNNIINEFIETDRLEREEQNSVNILRLNMSHINDASCMEENESEVKKYVSYEQNLERNGTIEYENGSYDSSGAKSDYESAESSASNRSLPPESPHRTENLSIDSSRGSQKQNQDTDQCEKSSICNDDEEIRVARIKFLIEGKESVLLENLNRKNSHFERDDEFSSTQLARAHWMQLHKLNLQWRLVQKMLVNVLRKHATLRAVWQFEWKMSVTPDEFEAKLNVNNQFCNQCTSYQAAITLIMNNLDNGTALARLLREFGAHHFYYDALDTHLYMLHDAFMHALEEISEYELDSHLIQPWNEFWQLLCAHMGDGIAQQRAAYLEQCITKSEMGVVLRTWHRVKRNGIERIVDAMKAVASESFEKLSRKFCANGASMQTPPCALATRHFEQFCTAFVKRLDGALLTYTADFGFSKLVEHVAGFEEEIRDEFLANSFDAVLELGHTIVRRAFMTGFIEMLGVLLINPNNGNELQSSDVASRTLPNENIIHTWGKVYRVHEQAIISNFMNRLNADVTAI